jgi:c-di-GMP-related signal transduction protein
MVSGAATWSVPAASRALALKLVQLVSADADTHEIEALLRQDPTLSYHLLRLVNSLGMGAARKVTSFSQAILILGRAQLRRWLNLMLFSSRESDPALGHAAVACGGAGRSMELLARRWARTSPARAGFMVGMFSLLGVLFGMPLAEVLQPLTISEELSQALLQRAGTLGQLLSLVEAAEHADLMALTRGLRALQIEVAALTRFRPTPIYGCRLSLPANQETTQETTMREILERCLALSQRAAQQLRGAERHAGAARVPAGGHARCHAGCARQLQ